MRRLPIVGVWVVLALALALALAGAQAAERVLPEPAATESTKSYGLRGPVQISHTFVTTIKEDEESTRRLISTYWFDQHGYQTGSAFYKAPKVGQEGEELPDVAVSSNSANLYDTQGHLVHQRNTGTAAREVLIEETDFLYDEKDRLGETQSTFASPKAPEVILSTQKRTFTYNAGGQVTEVAIWVGAETVTRKATVKRLSYPANGPVAEMVDGKTGLVREKYVYGLRGVPVQTYTMDGKGNAVGKIIHTCNEQGDVLRTVMYAKGVTTRAGYGEYTYDKYENWTARTRYAVTVQPDGKETLTVVGKEYRTITYFVSQ
ncbi:MAG: hypothetical protein ACYDBB_27110 [Armatimonadota bacterium]